MHFVTFFVMGFLGIIVFFHIVPVQWWIKSVFSGAPVSIFSLISMKLMRVPPEIIVHNYISLVKAGINIPIISLESLYLAGGNVGSVVNAFISAKKAGIDLSFNDIAAMDLAGNDPLEVVHKKALLSQGKRGKDSDATADVNKRSVQDYSFLLGKRGVADTAMRPVGIMLLDGKRYHVAMDVEYLDKGAELEVVEVDGDKIVVREV